MKKFSKILFLAAVGLISSNSYSQIILSEDFETGAAAWTGSGTNSTWAVGTPAGPYITGAASGTGALVTNLTGDYNNSENSFYESPVFSLVGYTNPELTFKMIREFESCCDEGWVEYTTDGTTWTKLGTGGTWIANGYNDTGNEWWDSSDAAWTTTSHSLVALIGQATVQIRFAISTDGSVSNDGMGIDDVIISEVTCAQPSVLGATNVTGSAADLFWTENGSATSWDVELGVSGFSATGTPTHPGAGSNTAFNVTGLSFTTTYDYYVRSVCAPGDSSLWAGPFTFSTPCGTLVAPWTEDFENAGSIPTCWTMTGGENWLFNTSGPNNVGANGTLSGSTLSNSYYATVDASGTNAPAQLFSPMIDVSGLAVPTLSFYEISIAGTGQNSQLEVDVWDGAVWNAVGLYNTNTNGWELKEIVLCGITFTGDAQVRFTFSEVISPSSFSDDIAIDDVTIDEGPSCPTPTDLVVSYADNDSTVINWVAGCTEVMWNVELGALGFVPGTSNELYTSSGMNVYDTIPGLMQLTDYDVYVQADCGADSSSWFGPVTFTTLPNCPDVSGIATVTAGGDTTFVSWTSNGTETMWDYEYGPVGFTSGTGTMVSVTATNDTILGLPSGGEYEIYFRSDCGGTAQGVWVGPLPFTAPCITVVAPWTESFDSLNTLPTCWDMFGAENWLFYNNWGNYGAQNVPDHTGNNGTYAGVDGSSGTNFGVTLETPMIDVSALAIPALEFYYFSNNTNDASNNTLVVEVWDGAAWNVVRTIAETNPDWVLHTVILATLNITGDVQVRFVVNQTASTPFYNDQMIDDVSVLEAPTCPNPTDFISYYTNADTVALSWTAGYLESNWNIEYGVAGYTPGTGTMVVSTDSTDTITGLNLGTVYDFYLQADCGGGDESVMVGPIVVATDIINDFTCDAVYVPANGSTSYFSNIGATQQAGEPFQGNGQSVWFKTVVPASGHLAIGTCGNDANTQMSVYGYHVDCADSLWMNNLDNTSFNPWGCDLNSPAGNEYCGLVAGDTVYFSISTLGTSGIFPVRAWDLQYTAGTGSPITVCVGDSVNVAPLVTGAVFEYTGYFDYLTNPAVMINDTTAATANFTVGNSDVLFIVENSCMADTATVSIDAVGAPNSGIAMDPFDGCNTGDVYLMGGLTGTVDAGGVWSDDDATGLLVGNIYVAATQPTGTYNFTYTVNNGICPSESTQVTVTLNDCVGVEETVTTFGLYPNPNNGAFSISSNVTEVATIQVLDAQGKVVYNRQINLTAGISSDVQLSNVTAGIYMVRLVTENSVSVQNIMVK
jgi:hypothetical protein